MAGSLAKVIGNIDLVPYYNDGSNGTGDEKVGCARACGMLMMNVFFTCKLLHAKCSFACLCTHSLAHAARTHTHSLAYLHTLTHAEMAIQNAPHSLTLTLTHACTQTLTCLLTQEMAIQERTTLAFEGIVVVAVDVIRDAAVQYSTNLQVCLFMCVCVVVAVM